MGKKNRDTIFVVVRTLKLAVADVSLCEAYMSLEAAEQAAGRMQQQMLDKGIDMFAFEVRTVTYYDE